MFRSSIPYFIRLRIPAAPPLRHELDLCQRAKAYGIIGQRQHLECAFDAMNIDNFTDSDFTQQNSIPPDYSRSVK